MKKIGSDILEGLMRRLSKLPLSFHYALCRFLSFHLQHVVRYRRKVVKTNLSHSFPEKSAKEIKSITKAFYRHFGEIIAETVWFGGCTYPDERLRKQQLCTMTNSEDLNDAFCASNGLVILESHAGNWEITGGWFEYVPKGAYIYSEKEVSVTYKKLSSDTWDRIMAKWRTAPMPATYKGYVESRNMLRHALENKRRKHIYVFPTDQYPYKYASKHEVESFLGQKTMTMTGAAALAHRLGMGVGMFRMTSISRGHYEQKFELICRDASQSTPEEIMSVYYARLEEDIKAQPWNYLWTHKRWKNLYSYKKTNNT